MKHIIDFIFAVGLPLYTIHYVEAGDICRTIFGCFAMWVYFNTFGKENLK